MSNQPFSPVTAEELETAVTILRDAHDDDEVAFASSGLLEPAKAAVRAGEELPRVVRFLGSDSYPRWWL